jgi:hypothetical protein
VIDVVPAKVQQKSYFHKYSACFARAEPSFSGYECFAALKLPFKVAKVMV